MERGLLQLRVLAIWVVGVLLLESVVCFAYWRNIDGFLVGDGAFEKIYQTLWASPSWSAVAGESPEGRQCRVEHQAKKMFKDLKERVDLDPPRTRAQFVTLVDQAIGGLLIDRDRDLTKKALLNVAAQDKVTPLFWGLPQIYLPWIAIMFIGLWHDKNLKATVPKPRVAAALGLSIALQVVFLLILSATLFAADLAKTEDLRTKAVLFSSLIGGLIQFVFPHGRDD